jgi:hypothetical protein
MWIFDQDKRQDRRDVAALKELLKTQLVALGERRYELTLRTRDDQVSYAHVTPADILDRVRDLRAVNMAGTDIALRPAERSGLVLLRDVPAARIGHLVRDGFPPVLLTELWPERFDAWVRLDSMGVQRGLHDSMAQIIAARYGGDTRTAGAEQAAPLAGFTTREDPDRRIPLVNADRESRVAPAALDLADWVLERVSLPQEIIEEQRWRTVTLEHARQEAERPAVVDRSDDRSDREAARDASVLPPPVPPVEPTYAAQFGSLRRALLEGGQGRLDERQAEWGAAHQLADTYPQLTRDELAEAIDKGGASGQGQGRTPPEREAYIARTAAKVLAVAQSPQGQGQEQPGGQDRPQKTSEGDRGR